MTDATPQTEKRSIPWHWIVLGLLVAAHAMIGTYSIRKLVGSDASFGSLLMAGVIFSQPMFFAFWAALAPQRFYTRFLWSVLLCTVICFFEELGRLQSDTASGVGGMMLAFLSIFVLATVLLAIVRWVSRWQIKHSFVEMSHSDYQTRVLQISCLYRRTDFHSWAVPHKAGDSGNQS